MKIAALVVTMSIAMPAVAAQRGPVKRAEPVSAVKAAEPPKTAAPPPAELEPTARSVQYGERDVIKITTKLRYTTLLVLPTGENILDFTTGDKEFWVIDGTQNLAYLKPAKAAAQTNLNLITASGNIYSFLLSEVSEIPNAVPDLKVFIEPKDESMVSAVNGAPRFVSSQVVEDYRDQVGLAKEETRRVKESAQAAIDKGIHQFVTNVRFPYRFEAGRKPFFVRAIYTDDKFTYLQARPEETPALYEIKDGKPNLVNFRYDNGVYVVEKVLDQGYLAIGKEKLSFRRED